MRIIGHAAPRERGQLNASIIPDAPAREDGQMKASVVPDACEYGQTKTSVIPDALQRETLLRCSGISSKHRRPERQDPGPALQHYVLQRIRDDAGSGPR